MILALDRAISASLSDTLALWACCDRTGALGHSEIDFHPAQDSLFERLSCSFPWRSQAAQTRCTTGQSYDHRSKIMTTKHLALAAVMLAISATSDIAHATKARHQR